MIIGIDEVGRGAWAGPMVVGAVAIDQPLEWLRDSKLIAAPARERFAEHIENEASYCSTGWVSSEEIDTMGLTKATTLAIRRALRGAPEATEIIIDGSYDYLPHVRHARPVENADAFIPAVMAASIIAKVARDKHMAELATRYPAYGLEKNVGYGTAEHRAALQDHGPVLTLHRCKNVRPLREMLEVA